MQTISISEKFSLQWVTAVKDYENELNVLRKLNFNPSFEDVTKENSPLTFAEGRKEVLFTVNVKDVTEAAFIKQVLYKI